MDAWTGGRHLVPARERALVAGRSAATPGVRLVRTSQSGQALFLRGMRDEAEPLGDTHG